MDSAVTASNMCGLSRVLLKVSTFDTYSSPVRQVQGTIGADRAVILTYLIILGHIWIKIVFAVKN